ncbi:extracellular solute-binding protein [Nonomuraea dietziae]|uniref:extracellular solute-binding protein n=1 Tax=Nonomuraea dietziae TaxID=65515 RepID=UPI0031E2D936
MTRTPRPRPGRRSARWPRRSAALGPGYIGYGEYSAGNTGGWHFTQSIYGRGGAVVDETGKKAAFNTPEGKAVLQNLKDMRWTDNSMGTKQLYQWDDLMRLMGAGKMGMILGAPDVITELHDNRKAKYEDFGLAAFPEAKATLGGGGRVHVQPQGHPRADQGRTALARLLRAHARQGPVRLRASEGDGAGRRPA